MQTFDPSGIIACTLMRWTPQIGDAETTGWITVAVYCTAALCAFLVIARRRDIGVRARVFWGLTGALMLLLAVNKQIDFQSALTAAGRCVAQDQGWYEERRAFQRDVVLAFIGVAAGFLVLGLALMRRDLRTCGLALCGLLLVTAFVAVRAVGFHHVDALISQRLWPGGADWRANVVLELSGLVLIGANALALLIRR